MAAHRFSVSSPVEAPADIAYGIIADYRVGHPSILPRPPFVSLDVEQGGHGAGTIIRVRTRMLGRSDTFRAVVTEPEPGRVLVETNDNGYVTTFTVEPRDEGRHALVTFTTEIAGRGVRAAIERWLAPRLLRPVYERELANLNAAAKAQLTS